jgi:hypothetical protein
MGLGSVYSHHKSKLPNGGARHLCAILRSTGAVGLMFAIACGSVASDNTISANYTSAEWQETCSLPSVTAGSSVIHDEQVTPVGDNEAAEKPAAS